MKTKNGLSNMIVSYYDKGYSQKEIHARLSVPVSKIRTVLQEYGYLTHSYRAIPTYVKDMIELLIRNNYSYRMISKILDISYYVVRDVVDDRKLIGVLRQSNPEIDQVTLREEYLAFSHAYQKGESFLSLYEKFSFDLEDLIPVIVVLFSDSDFLWKHQKNVREKVVALLDKDIPIYAISKQLHISVSIVKKIREALVHGSLY